MLSNGFDLNEFHPISMMRYMQSQYSEDKKIVQKQNKNNSMMTLVFSFGDPRLHLKMSKAYAHRNSKTKK